MNFEINLKGWKASAVIGGFVFAGTYGVVSLIEDILRAVL